MPATDVSPETTSLPLSTLPIDVPDNTEAIISRILYDPLTGKIIFLVVAMAIIYSVVKTLQRTVGNRVNDITMRYRIRKMLGFAGFVAFVVLITVVFSDKLGNLTVAFGLAGDGVAFALQETIASVAGWVSITFNHVFKPGDRIVMGGVFGDVIDVGVLNTTLMECGGWVNGDLYNGRLVRVSNSQISKEPIYNYTRDFPFLWDEIKIPVRYGSDLEVARSLIIEKADEVVGEFTSGAKHAWDKAVKRYLIENARLEPLVTLEADENWITFTLRYITDYRGRRSVKDALFTGILKSIDETDGAVKIASAAIDITAMPEIDIYVDKPIPAKTSKK